MGRTYLPVSWQAKGFGNRPWWGVDSPRSLRCTWPGRAPGTKKLPLVDCIRSINSQDTLGARQFRVKSTHVRGRTPSVCCAPNTLHEIPGAAGVDAGLARDSSGGAEGTCGPHHDEPFFGLGVRRLQARGKVSLSVATAAVAAAVVVEVVVVIVMVAAVHRRFWSRCGYCDSCLALGGRLCRARNETQRGSPSSEEVVAATAFGIYGPADKDS